MGKYYQCACGTEVINLEKDVEWFPEADKPLYDVSFYFSIYLYGYQNHRYTLKELLRYFWRIIKTGFPYSDNIILTLEEARRLADDLKKMVEEPIVEPEWVKKKREKIKTEKEKRL